MAVEWSGMKLRLGLDRRRDTMSRVYQTNTVSCYISEWNDDRSLGVGYVTLSGRPYNNAGPCSNDYFRRAVKKYRLLVSFMLESVLGFYLGHRVVLICVRVP